MAEQGRVEQYFKTIVGQGYAYNNEYTFSFQGIIEGDTIGKYLSDIGFRSVFSSEVSAAEYLNVTKYQSDKMRVLCEEISLPGVSSATGVGRGIHQGVDFKYAHTKLFNDLNITFVCDRDLTPLRFFQKWHNWIYGYGDAKDRGNDPAEKNTSYYLKMYDDYCLDMFITKLETKYYSIKGINKISELEPGNPVTAIYRLINAYPTSVSSIPLNSGASSVARVSVTLSYERFIFKGVGDSGFDK